jgi:hypothetical protein
MIIVGFYHSRVLDQGTSSLLLLHASLKPKIYRNDELFLVMDNLDIPRLS